MTYNSVIQGVKMQNPTAFEQKKAHSVKSVATLCDISPLSVRKEIQNGKLKAKKFGTKLLILDDALQNYLKELPDWKQPDKN
jgi:hypothetical protein